jgi:NAD(P)-dependent dehydrogenase (short-subunit alcohol dehydrogenase family)
MPHLGRLDEMNPPVSAQNMSTLFDLRGSVALVTGAAGGLGSAVSEALACHGARVIVSDADLARSAAVVAELRAQGYEAHASPCDLRDAGSMARLAKEAMGIWGRIDTLVCAAGIQGPAGPIGSTTSADWDAVMGINLASPLALTTHLIPQMAQRGSGCVVLMSSIAGLRGNRAIGLYALSKAALAQLARNLAVEWGPSGVRVSALSPGLFRTPLAQDMLANDSLMQRRLAATPLRRVGEPHEVAGAVVFLASRAGAFITGHNLVIDGGTTISDGN